MYKSLQIMLYKDYFSDQKYFFDIGSSHLLEYRTKVEETINSFVLTDASLDGSQMQANWFPQINADVFISHSHRDEELAIIFAGWLYEAFGLTAFIDSCVWGYANNLLRKIDNQYCRREATNSYDYNKRNYSTSHIHMMLSVALSQMIDNTECLFFLNTPNSITPRTVIQQTESPWIYSEIAMSRLIRRKPLNEHRIQRITESFSSGGELRVKYFLPTDHLITVDSDTLLDWQKNWNNRSDVGTKNKYPQYTLDFKHHALDDLYELIKTN